MKFIAAISLLSTINLVAQANPLTRNPKKGLAMHTAESCNALVEHDTSSWWYSWGAKSGFDDSFCDDPTSAETAARHAGMEFVPMFWNNAPDFDDSLNRMVDDEIHSNLQQSDYVLTYNEPELQGQANVSPSEAAQEWATIENIASAYNLQIVAPCTTQTHGVAWYEEWLTECNALYGRDCEFDYTCIHTYYQPYPCDSSDEDWACIQSGANRAKKVIEKWATNYPGKKIWVTEYACAPWGSENGCSAQEQVAIMNQLTPILEESPDVFRYAWFSINGGEGEGGGVNGADKWDGNGLNENTWTHLQGVDCAEKTWIGGFGTDASWKIQTKQECMAKADARDECAKPLILSMDDSNCYCSTSTECTLEDSYNAMHTWFEVGSRDSSALTSIGELYETFGAAAPTDKPSSSPSSSPSKTPSYTCYDYSDILPIDIDKSCTGRSLFLEIRAKYMEIRDTPGSPVCSTGLSGEIMGLTGTSTTEEAHAMFETWCEEHMEDWVTPWSRVGPPTVCYDNYSDVLDIEPGKCNQRKLFLHIRAKFMEARDAPGAEPCVGGLERELQALTQTTDTDAAHASLQTMCDTALQEAANQANDVGWEGSLGLEDFFKGTGFLNDETGNFQQEEKDFTKRGGYERFIYIGDDPRLNDHYPTTEASYQGGQTIAGVYNGELKYAFLTSPATTGFQEGSCSTSNAAICCWHRDRQYFDNNGNCKETDCANQNPGDNTDLCWTEDANGEIFPYPGDETEKDLHCHGFAWAQDEFGEDINAMAKWNNLFYVSLYDHLYKRGYVDSITDHAGIAGEQAMCGCVEDMNPVARADCTEAVGTVSYKAYQEEGGYFVVNPVPGTFTLKFQACQGFDYLDDFGPEDYAEFGNSELTNSNNDLSAFVFRQYLEGKLSESHVATIEETLIGYRDPSVNDGDVERDLACQAAFAAKYPELEWAERELLDTAAEE